MEKCAQENRNEDVLKVLAANKNDKMPEPGQMRVTTQQGVDKSVQAGMTFYSTSALTGDQVDVILPVLANELWRRKQEQPV